MKIVWCLFPFLISTQLKCQDFTLPQIVFEHQTDSIHSYIDLLNIEDNDALILKTSVSSYWDKGRYEKCLVYGHSGDVTIYKCFFPSDSKKRKKIKRKHVPLSKANTFHQFLEKCVADQRFDLASDSLNIRKKPNEDGSVSTLMIHDGASYSLTLLQGKGLSTYYTYQPSAYIEGRFPGWKHRKKLVELILEIEKLMEDY